MTTYVSRIGWLDQSPIRHKATTCYFHLGDGRAIALVVSTANGSAKAAELPSAPREAKAKGARKGREKRSYSPTGGPPTLSNIEDPSGRDPEGPPCGAGDGNRTRTISLGS